MSVFGFILNSQDPGLRISETRMPLTIQIASVTLDKPLLLCSFSAQNFFILTGFLQEGDLLCKIMIKK